MEKKQKALLTWGFLIVAIFSGVAFMQMAQEKDLAPIAKCITESGAKFYGAYWCPHCADQKAMFGAAVKFLPYIECASPTGDGQNPVCTSAGVESYPTWIFADGELITGTIPIDVLAVKAGCSV